MPLLISKLVSASVKHEANISAVCSPQDCFCNFPTILGLDTIKMKLNPWFNPVDEAWPNTSPMASHGWMLDKGGAIPFLMCIYLLDAPWVFPAVAWCHHSQDFLKVPLVADCFSFIIIYLFFFIFTGSTLKAVTTLALLSYLKAKYNGFMKGLQIYHITMIILYALIWKTLIWG